MNSTATNIYEVSENSFEKEVVEKSHEALVLVDFWAPWCGPCRALAPILDRIATAFTGKVAVAKVNTDVEQGLAGRFQIRGIPAVKLFRNGRVVDEFVGVQPESTIKSLVERHLPNEVDELIAQTTIALRDGNTGQAEALLREALTSGTADDRVKLALARLLAENTTDPSRIDEARALIDSLPAAAALEQDAGALRLRLDLISVALKAPSIEKLEQILARDTNDNESRFQLSAQLAISGNYEAAMEQLLEIIRRDRSFRDDVARKTLVGLFHALGNQHPLSVRYRTQLARALN